VQVKSEKTTLASAALQPEVEAIDLGRFVEQHLDRARRLAWRLVGGDEGAADDVVQEAFAKACRGLASFRAEARPETWLHRIIVNEAASHHRRTRLRRLLGLAVSREPEPTAPQPGDPALRRRIASAIDRLSRRQREVFVLVHLEQYTVSEAAMLLGKSEGSIKQHLHRALRRLRDELSELR
jgi:RNA polymerase sigma-70 factor (ECF subfamily)